MSTSKRTIQWVVAAALLVVLMLAGFAGAVFYRPITHALGAEITGAPTSIDPALFDPPASPEALPAHGSGLIPGAEVPAAGSVPDPEVLQTRIGEIDRSAAVGVDPEEGEADEVAFAVSVIDVETGERLAGLNADALLMPASNTKTLTVVALLNAVDDDVRFATRVLLTSSGELVLVGGGDPLLTSTRAEPGAYPAPASLEELAEQTAEVLADAGRGSVAINYDASLFTDPGWNETWPEGYRSQVTQISALWADTGRIGNARSRTPAEDAAVMFAEFLGAHGISVVGEPVGVSDAEGEELARVESLPVHVLAEQAMLTSDNSWTEVLGHQLALATGREASFDGAVAAIEEQLRELGMWADGAVLFDASGLSRSNLVTAGMLADVNRHIVTEPRLQVILDGMPVAGVTGTLQQRFNDEISSPARGVAKGKTGALTGVASLAGTTVTDDGRVVSYAAIVNGSTQPWEARVWIDRVVGTITGCGC